MSDSKEAECLKKHLADITKLFRIAELVEAIDLDELIQIQEITLRMVPPHHRADSETLLAWAKAIRATLPALEGIKQRGEANMRNVMNAGKN